MATQGRGAVFFFLGVVCLLLFDNDHSAAVEHRILDNGSQLKMCVAFVRAFLAMQCLNM